MMPFTWSRGMFVVPLKFMCSTQCETPVSPGRSSFEPTLYQHHSDASGAVCSSWMSTFNPLPRVVERISSFHHKIVRYMPEWKDTVNLPRTDFPMKANLPTSEPETLARWTAMDLYGQIRARRAGAPKFVLHDGPPYANGNIHMGTALNKILKEFVVKSRSMAGFDAPYVVGYDCHGLPIELRVDRELGPKKRDMSVAEFCRACRAYAERFIGVMNKEFQRLLVIGDWDHLYLTMDFRYQASIARALGKFVEQGLVYKGKKPVHWCIHCRTALAEAEVEYEDHTSPSIYVEFTLAPESASEFAKRVPQLTGRDIS